jgi:AGZA family xanthine/uracil permease-like MFS transporter
MLRDYFELDKRRTNVRIEAVAGATTFLTMAYIIFTHPNILEPTGMDKTALIAVTCLISALSTIAAGLIGNAPIAMAPGLGLNSIFALLVVSGKMDWQTALGVVFLSGLFFLLLTLVGLRKKIVEAIPVSLISAIGVGIGLFITFIGLTDLGIVVANPFTMVSAGPITPKVLIGLAGLLTMIFLESRNVRGSLLIGIAVSTVLAAATGQVALPDRVVSFDVSIRPIAFKLNVLGALKWSFMGSIFTLMFVDMFDSIGTLVACCHKADMLDERGRIRGLDRLLGVDAAATMLGALLGTSTTTSFAESASGIEQGGRSGLTAVVTGILFLVALLFIPVVAIVPKYATAPALIMVGLFMVKEVRWIEFGDLAEAFPSFIIIVMIALSYSISTGLAFGFVSFVVINLVSGRVRQIKPAMWVIAALSVTFLSLEQLPGLIAWLRSLS